MNPMRSLSDRLWPGATIVATMSTGATDSRFLNAAGTPSYGLSGMFHDKEGSRAHGLNERIRVKSLMDGRRVPLRDREDLREPGMILEMLNVEMWKSSSDSHIPRFPDFQIATRCLLQPGLQIRRGEP